MFKCTSRRALGVFAMSTIPSMLICSSIHSCSQSLLPSIKVAATRIDSCSSASTTSSDSCSPSSISSSSLPMKGEQEVEKQSFLAQCLKARAKELVSSKTATGEAQQQLLAQQILMSTSEDLSKLSVSELKKRIHELGLSTTDCFEKGDLVEKLKKAEGDASAKKSAPGGGSGAGGCSAGEPKKPSGNVKYGQIKIIGNQRNPKAVMTLMHGLGDSCDGWASTAQMLSQSHPDILFFVPTAPTIKVTMNMGMAMPAWYDITSLNPGAAEDDARMVENAEWVIHNVWELCNKHNVPHGNVVFAGFSQGSVIAMHAALSTPVAAPKGLIIMSGYAGGRTTLAARAVNKDIPILMCHGTQDPMLPLMVAQMSKQGLNDAGVKNIDFKTYPMAHSACEEEIADISKYLKGLGF